MWLKLPSKRTVETNPLGLPRVELADVRFALLDLATR